jgi:menaquinone-dependent protoporphyrinogen oxidase
VLGAYATKKGVTAEVAAAIGEELSRMGVDSDVHLVREVRDLRLLGPLVLGSAVYFGKWREEALAFGSRQADGRLWRPVELLEGGPTDASADEGKSVPAQAAAAHRVRARGSVMFGGRFLPSRPAALRGTG